MAFTDNEGGMVMPVSPMYGGNGFGNGFGDSGWWIILLFILLGNNGWGGYGNGGIGGFAADGAMLYPWMNQTEVVNTGFRDQMLNTNITSIRDGIGDISTQLCNGFAGVEQGANARQIANMQTAFGMQTAMNQGFNALGSQFADCCCEQRLGTADLKYTIATEECATRNADAMNTNSVLNAINGGIQSIKDQLCADKIDAKNDEIAQLRQELLYSRGQASQVAQNASIINGIYDRLNQCPVGTVPVYGEQPIFTCNNGGCGCGCGNNF